MKKNGVRGIITLLLSVFMMIGGCAKPPLIIPDDKVMPITGNPREFTETDFLNPALKYRPLPIIHADEYSLAGVNKANLDLIKEYGYGGIVSNVSFNAYLESEEMWESYVKNMRYAIDVLGLRVWLYDELHYPSGAAGGLVLKDNPQWQAEGLVNDANVVLAGGTLNVSVPYGHNLIFAKAFKGSSIDNMDLNSEIDIMSAFSGGTISWSAPQDASYVVVTQYSKYFYEGTHAQHNWAELRRYINVLKKEPVEKFIEVTHEEYKKRLGEYFGGAIEAIFTDEPSMLGTYFDGPPTTPFVKDPIDPNIPLYPTVNYSDDIAEKFLQARGYEMGNLTPYLFAGDNDNAKRFRWDYYKTLGELMAANYTGTIAEWCEQNNIKLTGHLLLEESIAHHPVFNGNIIRNLSNMQMPGVDILTAYPNLSLNWSATVVKFAASAAYFNGRTQITSEISDAFDGVKTNDIYKRLGSVAVQYAMGVNNISSFYPVHNMTAEENKLFTDVIGRMGYMLDGGVHESRVALYYPIEGVYIDTLPPEHLNRFNAKVTSTANNFTSLAQQLVKNQIDYDILDEQHISQCEIKDGALVTPYGQKFTSVVVPKSAAIEQSVAKKLLQAAEAGVRIVMQQNEGVLANTAKLQGELNNLLDNLEQQSTFYLKSSIDSVVSTLKGLGVKSVNLQQNNSNIVTVKHRYKDNSVFMFVNTSDNGVNITADLNETGATYKLWNVYDGSMSMLNANANYEGGYSTVSFSIPAGRCVFITVE